METTLNINASILDVIKTAAKSRGMSSSAFMIILLRGLICGSDLQVHMGRLVRYQRRGCRNDWRVVHIYIREDEYEYLLDLRKLFKFSISLLITMAVEKFITNENGKNNTDNYPFQNYIIIKHKIDRTICWILIWGYTDKLKNYIPHRISARQNNQT